MNVSRIPNRLALLAAFFVCITLGFTLAVVLRERLGSTAEEDPCFGQGEVVDSWQREVTQADIDRAVSASRPDLADMEPGMVEYRRCRSGPGYEVIIDDMGHVYSYSQPTIQELEAYYKEHPEENPQNQMATAEAKLKEEQFVTPALPAPETFADTILAGCDPAWEKKDIPEIGLSVCYPPGWTTEVVTRHDVFVGNDVIAIYLGPRVSANIVLDCPEPAIINTPAGEARLCAYRPDVVEKGQGHQIALPNNHRGTYFIREPSEENEALALRVALAAEELP